MCQRVQCRTCGKPTWTGCGLHIEQALQGVPLDDRCKCLEIENEAAPVAPPASTDAKPSWLSKFLGR